jgi:hypothetical protein
MRHNEFDVGITMRDLLGDHVQDKGRVLEPSANVFQRVGERVTRGLAHQGKPQQIATTRRSSIGGLH